MVSSCRINLGISVDSSMIDGAAGSFKGTGSASVAWAAGVSMIGDKANDGAAGALRGTPSVGSAFNAVGLK